MAAEEIRNYMKHVLKHFEFKLMCEEIGTVSFFICHTLEIKIN